MQRHGNNHAATIVEPTKGLLHRRGVSMHLSMTAPKVALLATFLLFCGACARDSDAQSQSLVERSGASQPRGQASAPPVTNLPDFTRLVAEYGDAVVNVEVT